MKKIKILFTIILTLLLLITGVKIPTSIAEGESVAKVYVETSNNTLFTEELIINGWVMSNDTNAEIKVYVDNQEKEIQEITRIEREDVISAIQGYGGKETNPKPGYSLKLNINDITDGTHNIEVRVVTTNGDILDSKSRTIVVEKYKAKAYIESPKTSQLVKADQITVSGWAMSNDEQAQIEIYVDNEKQEIQNIGRYERKDVIDSIKEYGTAEQNPTPGINALIDLKNISEGTHELKLVVLSREGKVLATANKKINVEKYKAKAYIESPSQGTIIEDTLQIEGWMMSDYEFAQIKVLANNKEVAISQINRFERQDVINAIDGYGGKEENPTPGFSLKINLSDLEHGKNKIEVQIVTANGEVLTSKTINIEVKKYKAKIYIDSPKNNNTVKPIMTISGWFMTNDEQAQVNVYIDNTKQNLESFVRTERNDVLNSVSGYGTVEQNPLPGFESVLNMFQVTEGLHTLKMEIVSRSGDVLATASRVINVEKYKAKIYIDSMKNGNEIKGTDILTIGGWLMSDDELVKIKLLIDGVEQKNIEFNRTQRDDVIQAIKGYGTAEQNPLPGYNTQVDLSYLSDGKHTVTVQAISITGEVIATATKTVEVDKYRADASIETPVVMGQAKSKLTVSGWLMTTDKEATINIYLNDKKQTITQLTRTERQDVINAIQGFGGIEENPLPGYVAQVDISNFNDGKYTLKVEVVSREGEVIYIGTRVFVIYNKYQVGIDVSKWNGTIDWSKVKAQGIEFAIMRAGYRGYGTEGTLVEDSTFVTNMKGAIENGIEVGVYFFSQAITEAEAIEEAEMTLRLIQENGFASDITFPIIIDTEAAGGRADNMSKEQRTAVVRAFCNTIAQAGYKPMIYANKDWLYNQLNMDDLSEFDVWLAHYTGTDDPANNPSDYKGSHQMWQYTSQGSVSGISGNVDMNICYKKYFK